MENLDGILKLAENEFDAVIRNGKFRSREEIDSIYKLIDIAKDIYCIWDYEESDGGMSYAEEMSYRGGSYDGGGGSYARGRGRNARRDSRGRYSSEGRSYRGGGGGSYRGYSRAGDKQEFVEGMREMMESAPDEQSRKSIERMIQQMENQ